MRKQPAYSDRNSSHLVRLILSIVVVGLLPPITLSETRPQDTGQALDILLAEKQYPELEQAYQTRSAELTPEARAYFEGIIANTLNHVQKSLELLQPVIPRLLVSNPARGEVALCTVADDYAKRFRYGDAARVYTEAARIAKEQNFKSSCDAGREASRWSLFSDAPVQTASSPGDFTIQGKWDSIGLMQVHVAAGAYTGSWILDSGANLSTISQSVADRIGVQVSSDAGTAEGGSGAAVSVHAAIVPKLRLGLAVLHNVPVLVAADTDLDFSNINYRIEGSLGLSVLAALERVTVYRDGRVRFGGVSDASENVGPSHNLFLENFTPVITADLGSGDRLFTIDTGAVGTILSSAFYRENKPVNSVELIRLELLGAGGKLVSPAYQVSGVGAILGGSCTRIETVQVLTEPVGSADEFYGNIGENALRSFTSFTFDFSAMHFSVDGGPRYCRTGP
jgi:predicted aspartyl protease